jgi:hypothetical protein
MIRELLKVGIAWAVMMGLAGAEFVVSGYQLGQANRPVVIALTFAIIVVLAFMFMELRRAPTIAKAFAVMAVFWMIVLCGWGSMDALTRSWYPVQHYNPD